MTKNHSEQFKECRESEDYIREGKPVMTEAVRWQTSDGKWHHGKRMIETTPPYCARFKVDGKMLECSNQHPACKAMRAMGKKEITL